MSRILESSISTMQYVKVHFMTPIPEVYFQDVNCHKPGPKLRDNYYNALSTKVPIPYKKTQQIISARKKHICCKSYKLSAFRFES
jgi:hypothetical protein